MRTEDFVKRNNKDWQTIHANIFGPIVPNHCEWKNIGDIISILNKIGKIANSNHMFYPDSGGLDLKGAKESYEHGCIELFTGAPYIIKPRSLQFESIDSNLKWNYFRIETHALKPSGIYKSLSKDSYMEEVCELYPSEYVNRGCLDAGEYNGDELPPTARPVIRYFKGAFVIFKKFSIYNSISDTYDGRHESLGAEGFKNYILETHLKWRFK